MSRICIPGGKRHRAKRDLRVENRAFSVRHFALCAFLLSLAIARIHATSRIYSTLDQLIARSDVIAVVAIASPETANSKAPSSNHAFRLTSPATLKSPVKGETPEKIIIHHGSGRDDRLFQQGSGEYLVFLKWQNDQLVPADGWPSSKFVTNGNVAGWSDIHTFGEDHAPLPEVISAIKAKENS